MKVLLISNSYLPNLGGLQSVTHSLATGLAAQGHAVRVITNRYPRALAASEQIDGIPVQRLLFMLPRWRNAQRKRLDLFFAAWFYFPLTWFRLAWAIVRFRPDVVNLHFVGGAAFFVTLLHSFLRFPLVVSLHGDDVEGLARGTRWDGYVFVQTMRHAGVVTACSNYLLRLAETISPVIRDKGRVIYNGFDSAQVERLENTVPQNVNQTNSLWLVAVGRLVQAKGFDVLLAALSECRERKWTLTLIGDGPEMNSLRAMAENQKLVGTIEFRGAQPRAQVAHALGECDAVIIPSRRDTFGMVAIEAMAAGKPVLATRVGGLPEVLEGADALLAPPENARALANALCEFAGTLAANPNFGARNRELAKKFSLERMVEQYVASYEHAAAVRAGRERVLLQ